jgi:hypothetical protein
VASGYCVPRQRATGRRAYDNITMLVMALYLSSTVEADYTPVGGMVALYHQNMVDLMGVLKSIPVEVPSKSLLLFWGVPEGRFPSWFE